MYAEEIKVDRQSICMADDVTAPNESVIEVTERDDGNGGKVNS